MKKILALLPLIGAFALTGCGGDKEEEGEGQNLEISQEQAKQKMKQLESSGGYEISFKTSDNGNESEASTIGAKDGYFWYQDEDSGTMYLLSNNDQLTVYEWDSENSKFAVSGEDYLGKEYYETLYDSQSTVLYWAFTYDGSDAFHKVKEFTYVGRTAIEYKLSVAAYGVSVTEKVYIDKETGITLYWSVEGHNIQGDSGSAGYQVTSFKTGAQVSVPRHD